MLERKNYTPMMQQYLDIKERHDDYVLMYRLGDFYEMFFDDANVASKELDLVLTGRDCGEGERAPMCGVPYHSAESYIARLISKGYKVAICEQTEDPAQAKGLVKREVVRMITPGTIIENSMLDEGKNNFIASAYMDSRGCGLCVCDISTGEAFGTEIDGADCGTRLVDELGRFRPSELLLSDGAFSCEAITAFARSKTGCHVERGGEWRFLYDSSLEALRRQFEPGCIESLNPEKRPLLVQAAGALLSYLHETQKNDLGHIRTVEVYEQNQFMGLDNIARRNLELTASLQSGDKKGSLLWVLDHTKCAMGARMLRQWLEKPLISPQRINERLSAVDALTKQRPALDDMRQVLSKVGDFERIMARIVYGSANSRDLRALWQACVALPGIKDMLSGFGSKSLTRLCGQVDTLDDLAALIDSAIVENDMPFSVREGGMIRRGYDAEVDNLRDLLSGGMGRVAAIEAGERARTGIAKLKVGYNRVFGYYIEISKSYAGRAPDNYIRKQTLANCERFITPELKQLEGEVLSAEGRLYALEYEIFCRVRDCLAAQAERVKYSARAVAAADTLASLATAALQNGYVMPDIDGTDVIDIRDGRHPVVERVLEDGVFVPNDALLDGGENRVHIVTGPNMAGKSTYMRQVALIVIMAQCGSFVPASSARVGVADRVFTRVGASDDMFSGRSTFMVEMNEVADIIKTATKKSLLILDEIGRGTSTFDGMAIARAVLEYAADRAKLGARTLFATHYHELCEMEDTIDGIKNYNVVVKRRGDDIVFIKKIVRGGASDSYGIQVAKLAGLPDVIIRRANELLVEIESRAAQALPAIMRGEESESEPDDAQLSLGGFARSEIIDELRRLQPDTFTPIEALSLLYELTKKAKEC